jgi:uncharacterized protein (TIGR02757 family)
MKKQNLQDLKEFLDEKADRYNTREFITSDPVSIPHRFTKQQDIEIAGLFAAVLAWGQRKTIINKTSDLLDRMGNAPHDFLLNHRSKDLRAFEDFKHRTFNSTDLLYFISFLQHYYQKHQSLESAFLIDASHANVESALSSFYNLFFSLDHPQRTQKHVATPARKSACKRINMYLRWMVRKDDKGVDFGIWNKISPSQLICPCDVHVERVARKLKLISKSPMNWQTAVKLTNKLKLLDPQDPVKYDFALFGLGVEGEF